MSNTWTYEMLLPGRLDLDQVMLARLGVEERGYSLLTPGGRVARVIDLDGMGLREYAGAEEAMAGLVAVGGGLQLWKGEIDLLLTFHPAGSPRIHGVFDPTPEGWSRMVLSVDGSLFRDGVMRSTVAADALEIFVGLCERLGAAYGFSRDEEAAEAFSQKTGRLASRVAAGDKPPLLFWVNYFRREHFPWLDEILFSRVGGWVTTFHKGMVVSLFDLPWEVDLDVLREVNHRWNT